LINFLKLLSKKIDSIKVIISGRLCWLRYFKILQKAGCKDIIVNDSKGAIHEGREDLEDYDGEVKTQKTIPTAVIRPNMKYQEKAIQILKYFPP
jgi:malic enzyme